MSVRKSTTTTVTGPREYVTQKGRVVGTSQTRTSITRSAPNYGKALELLRLPVYMLLFWLLVMAPFFTVMTTIEDGQIILAEDFQLTTFEFTFIDNEVFSNNIDNSVYLMNGTIFSADIHSRTNKQILPSSSTITLSEEVFAVHFWNGNTYLGQYVNITGFGWSTNRLGPVVYPLTIPSGATHFGLSNRKPPSDSIDNPLTFEQFSNIEILITPEMSISTKTYYDIMENARTAEYGNPFEFITFILNIPNYISESKPLAFLGIQTTTAEMNDAVQNARSITTWGNFRLAPILNPFRWGNP